MPVEGRSILKIGKETPKSLGMLEIWGMSKPNEKNIFGISLVRIELP